MRRTNINAVLEMAKKYLDGEISRIDQSTGLSDEAFYELIQNQYLEVLNGVY